MSWGYGDPEEKGGASSLMFGLEGSDQIDISFICRPGKDRIEIVTPAFEPEITVITLRSGKATRRYEAIAPEGPPDGYETTLFATDRADPVLAAFVRSSRFASNFGGGFVSTDARSMTERAAVAAFARTCGLG